MAPITQRPIPLRDQLHAAMSWEVPWLRLEVDYATPGVAL